MTTEELQTRIRAMHYVRADVLNRGHAPSAWLAEAIQWAKAATDEIFAPNPSKRDIYAATWSLLGPREAGNVNQWKAWMLEVMRVHAGFEASWNWNEGVDRSNQTSLSHKSSEETGVFQVSYDSLNLDKDGSLKSCCHKHLGADLDVFDFIPSMKERHSLALEYYARLIRQSITWAGPLIRHGDDSIYHWLNRGAVHEFQTLLEA